MTKAKEKKSKNKITNRNSVEKSNYTEEEKARLADFLKRSTKIPAKFKAGEKDSDGNPSLKLENADIAMVIAKFMEALGTPDRELQMFFIDQVVRTFSGNVSSGVFNEEKLVQFCNNGLTILSGIQPKDEIEGMLAVQMIGVHNVAMATLARSMITEQTFEGKQANVNQATKMLRTFTAQMEALKKYRTGGQQKVTVEHVHVNKGGQAIVGNVNQGGGGSYEKKEE